MELWVPVEGFPNYSVSSLGQVRNDHTGRILRRQVNQQGVVFVGMVSRSGSQRQRGVALMVAQGFLEKGLESFDTPIQVNGDRWDCSAENLMWRPRWFAIQYHMQFKHRFPYPIEEPLIDLNTEELYAGSWDVCMRFGLIEREVVSCVELRTFVWPTYQMFGFAN